jgi:UV DNA damage repair endonuclease
MAARTQFWKGAIQQSIQQNLVDIGSVVSEEKIFFKFHPPLFSNLHNRSKSAKVQSISQNELKFELQLHGKE